MNVQFCIQIAFIAFAFGSCVSGKYSRQKASVPSSNAAGLSPIEYLAFSDNLEELNSLNSIVENAQVVGLGEAHHTVGGYHRMIARSSKYMIERLGFTEVALETPWEHAGALTDYVNNCDRDDPLPAMQTIFSQFA